LALSLAVFLLPAFVDVPAGAADSAKHKSPGQRERREAPYQSALLIEAETGRVLRAHNPRLRVIPASIVKMMTALIVLEHLEQKKIHLHDVITVSRAASRIGGQQVYLKEGERFRLEELMKAILISSANDAAYAVAEHVAGDESAFVEMMNGRARQLGMTDSRFVNPHGLPPGRGKPVNLMSARDAGLLAQALLRHPPVLEWSSKPSAPFRNGKFTLWNTNRLLGRFPGMDGLKTGYYPEAGFSIVATARRDDLRLIGIIFGSSRSQRRFEEAKQLLAWGFSRYRWYEIAGNLLNGHHKVRVLRGRKGEVPLEAQGKVRALIRRSDERRVEARAEIPASVPAPVRAGQEIGRIVYELGGNKLGVVTLHAAEPVESTGFLENFIRLH